jgi:hypothetical protein
MTSPRRWTGCAPGRTASKSSSPAAICARAASRCSTCPRSVRRAAIAGWPPTGAPATASEQGADRVRAAHRLGRAASRGTRVHREHRDPKTCLEAADAVRGTFRAAADDHGRGPGHDHQRGSGPARAEGMAWITCLHGPAIKKLMFRVEDRSRFLQSRFMSAAGFDGPSSSATSRIPSGPTW